ncbi:MAG: glycine--tRNA ligase subunit beta [bacterium]|nr:glycine--tRNA ligase subunit beta [bacterium]
MTGARMLPFLFEIGTDELPARFLPVERQHVGEGFTALLAELSLAHRGLRVLATPRRLAVLVEAVAEQQADRTIEVKGPPLTAARGPDGSPTPAALGFARKNGVEIGDCLELGDGKGGAFLGVRRTLAGRTAAELLAERLPGLLLSIPFPKTMHWGTSDLEYARPIQWLVAILGEQVLPLEMAGLRAGRVSRGHRTLADGAPVEIPAPGDYLAALRAAGVEPDQDERRRVVREGGESLSREAGGRIVEDEELLQEVTDLLEHPTPFLGAIPESYFALPDEVIITALKSHQRYFAVRRAGGGGLLPVFFAVRDGDRTALDNVVRGNEKVLNARLNDALFYWRGDLKLTPDQHTARLADVTWLEGYGSVLDKVGRVGRLVERLWSTGLGDGGAPPAELIRAARICKFDLVTEMIRDGKEFTKLEGTIGARYAAAAGESPAVCELLEEYYRPRSAADGLPAGGGAAALAVADRLDNLAGCWLAGFAPTGAKDPYALRRHTLAVLRILLDRAARLDLDHALAAALEGYAALADADRRARARRAPAFARTRLEATLVAGGVSPEAVRAVLPAHGNDPTDAAAWARALDGFREQTDFLLLAKGFKRCRNILEGRTLAGAALAACAERWRAGGHPDGRGFDGLPEPAETALAAAVAAAVPGLLASRESGDYIGVFRALSALGPDIDGFFETVRVNADQADLRELRHAFLREVYGLFARFADFSEVAPWNRPLTRHSADGRGPRPGPL